MSDRKNKARWYPKYGYWSIKVQRDGERRQFYSSLPGRAGQIECQNKADDWLDYRITSAGTPMRSIAQHWLDEVQATTTRSNYRGHESRYSNWIAPVIGARKAGKVTEQHLKEIVLRAYRAGKSRAYLMDIVATVRELMSFARATGASKCTGEYIRVPKDAPTANRKSLQVSDIYKLMTRDKTMQYGGEVTDYYIHAYRVQMMVGYRPGELLGLQVKRDIQGDYITMHEAINDEGEVTHGKTINARRVIKMYPLLRAEVDAQLEMLRRLGVKSAYLFPASDGSPTRQDTYRKRWRVYRDHNDISDIVPYELRHTFFSVNQDLPDSQLKPWGGHSKSMPTRETYAHTIGGEIEAAAEAIQANFAAILAAELETPQGRA